MSTALPLPTDARANAIGFLRLLLAGLVVYSHAHFLGGLGNEALLNLTNNHLIAGTFAVQAFFVLSGWLLTVSWLRRPELGAFLRNRALRLLPGLWLCLVLTACGLAWLVYATTADRPQPYWEVSPSPLGYIYRNLFLPRSQVIIGGTLGATPWPGDWNGSLWTLFYEGACYLILAAAGFAGLLTRWRVAALALLVAVLALHPLWRLFPHAVPALAGRLFDTEGKILCLHFAAGTAWALLPATASWLRSRWLAAACAVALFVAWKFGAGPWASPWLLPPILLSLVSSLPLRGWENKLGGDYSYGLYVYGYPVQQMLAHFHVPQAGFLVYFLTTLLIAGALAVASWHLVEGPALRLKSRRASA